MEIYDSFLNDAGKNSLKERNFSIVQKNHEFDYFPSMYKFDENFQTITILSQQPNENYTTIIQSHHIDPILENKIYGEKLLNIHVYLLIFRRSKINKKNKFRCFLGRVNKLRKYLRKKRM